MIDIYISTGSSGDGSEGLPYEIACQADIDYMAADVNLYDDHFVVTRDIYFDANSYRKSVISEYAFNGVFNGNDHKIINMKIDSSYGVVGLFVWIGENGKVINLGIEEVNINHKNIISSQTHSFFRWLRAVQ